MFDAALDLVFRYLHRLCLSMSANDSVEQKVSQRSATVELFEDPGHIWISVAEICDQNTVLPELLVCRFQRIAQEPVFTPDSIINIDMHERPEPFSQRFFSWNHIPVACIELSTRLQAMSSSIWSEMR